MATQTEQRQWRAAVDDVLTARRAFDRYELRQRELRRGRPQADERPAPLEFDEVGFPIPQPIPRFMQRIGRLIHG